jgi:hypothetical protein
MAPIPQGNDITLPVPAVQLLAQQVFLVLAVVVLLPAVGITNIGNQMDFKLMIFSDYI